MALRRRKRKAKRKTLKNPRKVYKDLEKKIDRSWRVLRRSVKKRSRKAILKGRRELLLLLGECNYMAREYARYLKRR